MKEQVIKEVKEERLEILEEIQKLEREGKFDIDPEKDPPTIVLTPDNVDYLHTKSTSKWKSKVANKVGLKFLDSLFKILVLRKLNYLQDTSKKQLILLKRKFNVEKNGYYKVKKEI